MHDADRSEPAPAGTADQEERPDAGSDPAGQTTPGRQPDGDRPGTVAAADDAELAVPYWLTSTEEAANTTFLRMVRRLPRLLRDAWLLAWHASPATTAAVLILQLAAGVASAVGLLSVVGVFDGLLQAGPTPERVRAAVPSLLLVVAALAARALLKSAATAAHGRLSPMVSEAAEMRLLDLTTRVDLSTFDDPDWRDAMERARDRGIEPGSTAAVHRDPA
jgi:ATP-binding cassette subfamily B protein